MTTHLTGFCSKTNIRLSDFAYSLTFEKSVLCLIKNRIYKIAHQKAGQTISRSTSTARVQATQMTFHPPKLLVK